MASAANPTPVRIHDYDLRWPQDFEGEKAQILQIVGSPIVAVEHVGSTAVPGLGAKPIIDIMVGARSLEDAARCFGPLREIGYEYVPEYEAEMPDRRYFHKGPRAARTHHLHMVEFEGPFWRKHLVFRDFLRTHPDRARVYEGLKRELAARFVEDRVGYTEAKTKFIEEAIAEVMAEQAASGRL